MGREIALFLGRVRTHQAKLFFHPLFSFFVTGIFLGSAAAAASQEKKSLHEKRLARDSQGGAYVWDIPLERSEAAPEKLILPTPPETGSSIHHLIFNPALTKEFALRYEERFGRTTAEQTYNVFSSPFATVKNAQGLDVTAVQTSDSQRQFGEYMVRRLAEWHADNALRTSKSLRGVAEIKDRYSKADVQVAPGYKLQANYSIGNNAFDVVFDNPWVLMRARVELILNETFVTVGRSVGLYWRAETHWALNDGIVKLVTSRPLSPGLSMSFMGSTSVKPVGYSRRENLGLAGLSYNF
ncbi:MAG: hypothetical protein K2X47_16965 [Bdellovibrionales bacterium]|nr:hypothetical protein [Bdellovibrionales bacterium]